MSYLSYGNQSSLYEHWCSTKFVLDCVKSQSLALLLELVSQADILLLFQCSGKAGTVFWTGSIHTIEVFLVDPTVAYFFIIFPSPLKCYIIVQKSILTLSRVNFTGGVVYNTAIFYGIKKHISNNLTAFGINVLGIGCCNRPLFA